MKNINVLHDLGTTDRTLLEITHVESGRVEYVVCWGYDPVKQTWLGGSYFDNLYAAQEYINM